MTRSDTACGAGLLALVLLMGAIPAAAQAPSAPANSAATGAEQLRPEVAGPEAPRPEGPAAETGDTEPSGATQALPRPKPAPAAPHQTFAHAPPAPYATAFQAVPRTRPEDAPPRFAESATVPVAASAGADACFADLTRAGIAFEPVTLPTPEDARCEPEPGATISVATLGFGEVDLEPAATANCSVVAAFNNWMALSVLPAAEAELDAAPATVLIGAGYTCRPRNRQAGAKISEHGHANALDVMGFVLADGRRLEVLNGWQDDGADGRFLRRIWSKACEHFTTVLGPEADSYHANHLHLDLAARGRSGRSRYCK